jgi:integrase/recombinase XerD
VQVTTANEQLIEFWLNSGNYAANSKKSYRRHVGAYLEWLGDRPLWDVTPLLATQYKLKLSSPPPGKPPISQESANAAMAAIKAFSRWHTLTRLEPGAVNPWLFVKLHKPAPLESKEFPIGEFSRLQDIAAADSRYGPRDSLFLELLRHGLRAGEVLALNMQSFREGRIFIATSKNGSSREIGTLPGFDMLMDEYLNWRQVNGFPWEEGGPLILSLSGKTKGQRLSYAALHKRFRLLLKKAGIDEQMTPHWLRHLFSSDLLRHGVPPAQAMLLTGHRSAKTFRRYTIAVEQDAAIEAFQRAYNVSDSQE